MTALAGFAAAAPASVFAAVGPDMSAAVDDLSLEPGLSLAPGIREAAILLVAGTPRAQDIPALRRLHDQMPHPRATVWWGEEPDLSFDNPAVVFPGEDPAAALAAVHRALVAGDRESETDILPNEPPNEWQGVGPHGQGGEGMMGGTPYGRPMPMMGEEHRDGLMLDAYTACFGPFLPLLPPGLALELTLQGDVIQNAAVRRAPFADRAVRGGRLRTAARLLDLLGLDPHAARLRRLARDGHDLRRAPMLARLIRFSGAMQAIPPGLGFIPEGPARAAAGGADVRARLRRFLFEPEDAPVADRPSPKDVPDADLRLVDLLSGREWAEAMLVINSFPAPLLVRLCPVDPDPDEGEDDGDDAHDAHGGGHGGHGHQGSHGSEAGS